MIYTEKTYKHLLFCGDIHDHYDAIPNFIRDHELDTCAVFQAGDFGIGFETDRTEQRRLNNLNKRMINSNSDVFAIRGNHDDPKYFDGNTVLTNVNLLKDYTVVNINGWNVLCVGGAISVDRTDRTSWWWHQAKKTRTMNDWWVDEVLNYDEDILNELRDIDIVVTHSAPNFCNPLTKGNIKHWLDKDDELDTDILVERHLLTRMYDVLMVNNNISEWYYGHFHFNTKSYRDNTTFTALDIDNIVASNKVNNYDETNE